MPGPRTFLIYAISLVAVFGIAFGIGYVYQYNPERDVVELVIDRTADVSTDSDLISGIVRDVSGDAVTIETESGSVEIPIGELTFEELLPLDDPAAVPAGTTVNLGGERTPTERVITGLVFLDGEAQP